MYGFENAQTISVGFIFFIGLTSGGLSCLAVQGGLLASLIANQKELEIDNNTQGKLKVDAVKNYSSAGKSVSAFLLAKLVAHTILGFLLGWLGSLISLGLGVRLTFQALVALFMLATALNLLNIHPTLRYLSFQPPRFLRRLVQNSTKHQGIFAPALLGLLTIFIPCGVTQAMEVVAISSGNAWAGAAIMFIFVLGTSPLFGILGIATARFSDRWRARFLKITALVLIFMSLYSVNGLLQVLDAPITYQKIASAISNPTSRQVNNVVYNGVTQKVEINILNSGYSPSYFMVKKNIPVELILTTENVYSCAAAFSFRAFGIFEVLKPTDQRTFTFTPNKNGKYTFSCSMGMYSGVMEVI